MPEPPKHIIEDLKRIDKNLDVKWNPKIRRFMVHHKDRRHKIYPVMRVQYQDGSYKPLDQRTVQALRYSDHLRRKRPQDVLYEIDKQNEEVELKKQKQFSNHGQAIAKELPRGFVNVGGVPLHQHKP